ncbi:MAG: hypothetical protein V3U84_00105 [Thiotrichaceae bacterium]
MNRQVHQDASTPLVKTSCGKIVDIAGGKWGCLGAHALRKITAINMQIFEITTLTGFLIIVIIMVTKYL